MHLRERQKQQIDNQSPKVDKMSDDELFQFLHSRPTPGVVVDWSPSEKDEVYKLRFEVLSKNFEDQCKQKAIQALASRDITPDNVGQQLYREELSDQMAVEILSKAVKEPEEKEFDDGRKYHRFYFMSADDVRQCLTTDELSTLFELYMHAKYKIGENYLTREFMRDLEGNLEKIAKGASADPLVQLPSHQLANMVMGLAEALYNFPSSDYQNTSEWTGEKLGSEIFGYTQDASDTEIEKSKKKKKSTKKKPSRKRQKSQNQDQEEKDDLMLNSNEAKKIAKDDEG